MNILTLAHGHPNKHKGGGEVAAYAMHTLLKAAGHQSVFVGWGGFEAEYPEPYLRLNQDEYEIYSSCNFFDFSASSDNALQALTHILNTHQPDVVHLHHYVHLGIEVAAFVKHLLPRAKVVLTLHEYLALCMNNGQLFTSNKQPCQGPSLQRCVQCFPQHSEADFFRRRLSIQAAFSYVDHFVAPSEFLRQQYIAWGIAPERIHAIENPLRPNSQHTPFTHNPPNQGDPWVLGFFGQINYYKGLDVILDGVEQALERGVNLQLNIHGKYSEVTGADYIDQLKAKIHLLGQAVRFWGPYQQDDVLGLMSSCHFVMMGSRWYENSPVVIQEAIAAARPLIVPALGGMAEKAQATGLFFASNQASSLAQCLQRLNADQYQQLGIAALHQAQQHRQTLEQCLYSIIALYEA